MQKSKKISFIIATNREPQKYINVVIDNINSMGSKYPYEICIFSSFEVKGENVLWFEEKGRMGPVFGFNYLANKCNGEFICQLTDDHIFLNSIDLSVDFLESDFENKKFKICTLNAGNYCGNPVKGQLCGDDLIDFDIDKYPLCRFPFLHHTTLDLLDGLLYNNSFFYHAPDIWLGYWLGINGEPVMDAPTHIRAHNPAKDSSNEVHDCNTCRLLMKKTIGRVIPYNYFVIPKENPNLKRSAYLKNIEK